MHTPDNDPHNYDPQQSYAAKKLSKYDMQVAGIVVYLVAMAVLFVVALVLMLFGTGTVTRANASTSDAPGTKNKVAELTQPFPAPQPHPEDTNDDIAILHAREDLLLDHYSWADREHGKVRIPIARAMELIAQRGLPTAQPVESAPLMTGESKRAVAVPLTSGFARTADEQAQLKNPR